MIAGAAPAPALAAPLPVAPPHAEARPRAASERDGTFRTFGPAAMREDPRIVQARGRRASPPARRPSFAVALGASVPQPQTHGTVRAMVESLAAPAIVPPLLVDAAFRLPRGGRHRFLGGDATRRASPASSMDVSRAREHTGAPACVHVPRKFPEAQRRRSRPRPPRAALSSGRRLPPTSAATLARPSGPATHFRPGYPVLPWDRATSQGTRR